MTDRPKRSRKKTPAATVVLDPVTTYAAGLRDGSIVAGRAVRLAGARHFLDLERQCTAAFPFYFDPDAANHVIDFFPDYLTLEDGLPFHLPPWLQFCYGSIYGWKVWTGKARQVFDPVKGARAVKAVDLPKDVASRGGLRRFQHGFFETSKGSGKALALDTPIATVDGWSTMGALRIGDRIFDERGCVTTVIGAFDVQYDRQCFEVEFDDGSVIVADAEHLWFTEQRTPLRADGKIASAGVKRSERGQWRHGVRTTREIARTLRYKNGKYRSANHSVPLAFPIDTPPAVLPIDPYILGAWLGDGDSDCGRITVGQCDMEMLEHLVAAGGAVREHAGSSTPRFSVRDLTATLRKNELLRNKHVPVSYLRASIDQRLSLLQGLMDTDGYINPQNGECEFCTTDSRLADGVLELIVGLGIKARSRESAAKLNGLEVSRRWRIQFQPPAYLPVFRLRRKLRHQVERHNRRRLSADRRIEAVRPVASVPVRCIAVDSTSRLFLAGRSMVPTHNTPSAGGIGLYGLAFDDEPYAEVYTTGFDTDQAAIILNDAIRMGQASPDLLEILLIDKYNIAHPSSGSFMRAMSSQHRSKSGPRPQYVLSDEIHEHRDGTVITKAEAGFKNRLQPLGLKYTNSGSDRTSYCWQLHQKSIDVLESAVHGERCLDDQWFAYVCHLDPCQACYDEGYRQPKDGCPDCDDWMNPKVWPKVAPALGIVIQPKYLQDAITAALTIPSDYNLKRRLNFCIWTETHNSWISSEKWATCKRPSVSSSNDGLLTSAAGLDPSNIHDLSSFVVALRHDDPPGKAEQVEIEGLDELGQRVKEIYELNFHVELIPFFWLPKANLNARVAKERIPWDVWARTPSLEKPYIFTTPGPSIDHEAIYAFVMGDAWKRFKCQKLGMDENGGRYLFEKFKTQGKLGDNIVSVGQGKKLSEAFKFIEILIAHGRLWHDGNPVLGMCFANAEPHTDRTKALWIEKPADQAKCIDGAVASAMAIRQLMALPKRKKKSHMFFVGGSNAPTS